LAVQTQHNNKTQNEQNKTKQNKTKQNKTKQNKTKQNKTKHSLAGHRRRAGRPMRHGPSPSVPAAHGGVHQQSAVCFFVWFGLVWFGLVWFGLVSTRFCLFCCRYPFILAAVKATKSKTNQKQKQRNKNKNKKPTGGELWVGYSAENKQSKRGPAHADVPGTGVNVCKKMGK
jgi:Flp pilus assembly protein TadB